MIAKVLLPLALLSMGACASTSQAPQPISVGLMEEFAEQREVLLTSITNLEGTWRGEGPGGEAHSVFAVSSGGNVVREIMFPGSEQEMTNMYALDGNRLALTHYCAIGNQPRMVADGWDGNALDFHFDSVSDLKASDEAVMGEMTLTLLDADTIEQRWRAFKDGEQLNEAVFTLHRER